ncbi:hypothetical protein D7V93_34060 [Corallococcus llansteffanensis]|uniref:Endonuclease/exonuclease/phosphatase family protein n=1 Tax=Corallococcus llansteffanensis TaxID=2316731 RepID=A0A3A8NV60_9BACT|nr:hypothetical protein D7V93_34060 [Corallococcus llansteffanensis]
MAAPLSTKLLPQNALVQCSPTAPCTQPTVDGAVPALEYADGKMFPLQDYMNGGPNGDLFLYVSDNAAYTWDECNVGGPQAAGIPFIQTNPCHSQSLFIGMRLPVPKDASGNFLNPSGIVTLWLDAKRDDTLNLVATASKPRDEDRRIMFRYSTGPGATTGISQSKGDGTNGWIPLAAPTEAWTTTAQVMIPAWDLDHVHIEFEIKLAPGLSAGVASEPLLSAVRKLGLGIIHAPASVSGATQMVGGGRFPNAKDVPPFDLFTETWETLEFKEPAPIPLSFTMWNVGQMPDATFWVNDGGSGEIDTVARKIFRKEVACISEIWMSYERGELIEKVNKLRADEGLPPMQAITELNDNTFQLATESTGLVLLSSRQILEGGVHHFPSHMCTSDDCLQDKGVIWARIATPAATAPVLFNDHDTLRVAAGTDYAEFVDVFCTHVNAGENTPGPDTDAREDQLFDIKAYAQQVRRGGPLNANSFPYLLGDNDIFPRGTWPGGMDRPAFLLGDMNTLGPKHTQADTSFPRYQDMVGPSFLDISGRTEFEKANTLFSEKRDLARTSSGADPLATGTWLSSACADTVADELGARDRIDYVLVFPPEDTTEFPAFALLKEPTASVSPHFDPDSLVLLGFPGQLFKQCLSDHAMVDVTVNLARVKDVAKYNPAKEHRIEYSVKQVTDLETASGCCADWFSPRVMMRANGVTRENTYLNVMEDQTIYPNWFVHTGPDNIIPFPDLPAAFSGTVNMTSEIWEADTGPNDHYDSIPEGGAGTTLDEKDAHFSFSANSGVLRRVKGETLANDWLTEVELLGSFLDGYENGISLETQGQDTSTGNNARVRHFFNVKELESP